MLRLPREDIPDFNKTHGALQGFAPPPAPPPSSTRSANCFLNVLHDSLILYVWSALPKVRVSSASGSIAILAHGQPSSSAQSSYPLLPSNTSFFIGCPGLPSCVLGRLGLNCRAWHMVFAQSIFVQLNFFFQSYSSVPDSVTSQEVHLAAIPVVSLKVSTSCPQVSKDFRASWLGRHLGMLLGMQPGAALDWLCTF